LLEEISVYKRSDDVVKGMCSSCNGESSYSEEHSEVDAGESAEAELKPVESRALSESSVEEDYVVMRAK